MKLEQMKRPAWAVPTICLLLILVVLYPLSLPPTEILFEYGYLPITDQQGKRFYSPLRQTFHHARWIVHAYDRYEDLWIPLYPQAKRRQVAVPGRMIVFPGRIDVSEKVVVYFPRPRWSFEGILVEP